jgi:urease accessory protein
MKKYSISLAALGTMMAGSAFAHTGHDHIFGFMAGFMHPFTGFDHLSVMVAVGLWATFYGVKKGLMLPLAFVIAMIGGGALSGLGLGTGAVENIIGLSVIAFGLILALRVRVPVVAAAALSAVAGAFHGYAHGLEATGNLLTYGLGFVVATSLLHLAGAFGGMALARNLSRRIDLVRLFGGAMAVTGLVMIIS